MFIWRLCHWSSTDWKPAVARRHTRGVTAHDTETNCVFGQCPGTVRAVSRRAAPWLEPGKPPAKMPGRRLGHVYRAEQLLSLSCKQAIDANPETTQIYLHCADEPFATSQSSNLKASRIHHHLSNSCPGTHSYSQQLFGWQEHSFI